MSSTAPLEPLTERLSMVRRLAAILAADVVGFSHLMSRDESGTLERLKSLRNDLVQPVISDSGGRTVKLMGDGLLAEFPSIVDAVQCAVDIQLSMIEREVNLPERERIRLRIGVNLGDIIVEGRDIYGDGVNIAARLESLADAGGVCISAKVFDEISKKVSADFEDMGEKQVKNIPEPLHVYRWITTSPAPDTFGTGTTLATPDKPSIAVLPFTNMSGNPEQAYIGDGMSEEILNALASIPDLFVVARNSSFVYRDRAENIGKIGRELGVRYVLEGSIRQSGNRVRTTAQLIEAESGNHLWSERYDRELEDIFAVQDEISRNVAIALQSELGIDAALFRFQGGTTNHRAWQLCLKGIEKYNMHSRGDNIECRRLLEQAVALDPDYEGALAMLGWANYAGIRWDFFDETERAGGLARLQEIIKILLAIDPDHGDGHFLTCALKIIECDLNGAIEAGEKAVAKKPNDPNTHAYLAQTYSYAGRSSEALSRLNYVMRLSPHYPTWMLGTIASILYRTGKYAEAIEYARRSVNRAPDSIPWQAQLTAFYGAREQVVEGEAALARLYELDPQYTITKFRKIHQPVDAKYYDILRNGLQKLGVPE